MLLLERILMPRPCTATLEPDAPTLTDPRGRSADAELGGIAELVLVLGADFDSASGTITRAPTSSAATGHRRLSTRSTKRSRKKFT